MKERDKTRITSATPWWEDTPGLSSRRLIDLPDDAPPAAADNAEAPFELTPLADERPVVAANTPSGASAANAATKRSANQSTAPRQLGVADVEFSFADPGKPGYDPYNKTRRAPETLPWQGKRRG
jgi:hypothetical protein